MAKPKHLISLHSISHPKMSPDSAELAPMVDEPVKSECLGALDRSIERDPGHHLRMDKMPPSGADFPDPFVRRRPYLHKVGHMGAFEIPPFRRIAKVPNEDAAAMIG
jgi:hypothetical protein